MRLARPTALAGGDDVLVVVDTNIVVAGLLTSDPGSPTARILDGMLDGGVHFVVSVDLLAEYRTVLLRPAVMQRHGLSADEVDELLEHLAQLAAVREAVEPPEQPPDPGDLHLWALLAATPGAALVTGDRELLEHPPSFARVVSATDFVVLPKG